MRFLSLIAVAAVLTVSGSSALMAHCEVPCGIYDDHMRVHMIEEHCTTLEKAMTEIKNNTATAKTQSEVSLAAQQAVRWVTNKEKHATEIQTICSRYFLTQRIKPDQADYHKKLELLHGIMVSAMKAKQTVDPAHVARIRSLLAEFEKLYFSN
ncbi:MAG: superoxide dismutase [Candidatus Glassbacteria bacterium]|nr:superoxide dismutase [Candidatus Glassbacteria bacterium]